MTSSSKKPAEVLDLFQGMTGKAPSNVVDPPSGGGDDGDMDARLSALETKWETVVPTLATKADLAEVKAEVHRGFADVQKGFSDMVKWIVGVGFVGMAAFITIMTFVLNNATPKTPPTGQQAPIIIQVPSPTPAPTAPPAKP